MDAKQATDNKITAIEVDTDKRDEEINNNMANIKECSTQQEVEELKKD